MKIICPLSSIEFTVEYFSSTNFSNHESVHPIFHLPQKSLISHAGQWAKGNFDTVETYLLYLALLKSSKLITFKTAARPGKNTQAACYQNMEPLLEILLKLNSVPDVERIFPKISITRDTGDLFHSLEWIKIWEENYKNWKEGYKFAGDFRELDRRTMAVSRLVKSPHISPEKYASQLASWAALAGEFPEHLVLHPISKIKVPCSEYWQDIIKAAPTKLKIIKFPEADIERLQGCCMRNIELGTLQSKRLFDLIDQALETHRNFLGIGTMDIATTFKILSKEEASKPVQEKNLSAITLTAPETAPKQEDFVSKLAYIRAKLAWELRNKKV